MHTNHFRRGLYPLAPAFALALGAVSQVEPVAAQESALPYPGCEQLGRPLSDHACFHAEMGPFRSVDGGASTLASIDAVHTQFTVSLAAGEGAVTYRPARAGHWALFSDVEVPLVVLDGEGNQVAESLVVSNSSCAFLPHARVYQLTAGVRYQVEFGPSAHQRVGLVLERLGDFETAYYPDGDSDGFGDSASALRTACIPPSGFIADDGDCEDSNPAVHPLAQETADRVDNNCNGFVDEGVGGDEIKLFYMDLDRDGFGDRETAREAIEAPTGYIEVGGDCNDIRADIFPGAVEVCDNLDNDCDDEFDEGFESTGEPPDNEPIRYIDVDGDGYGSPGWVIVGCHGLNAGAATDNDCDDTSPLVHPGAEDVCDGIDNNCDEQVDTAGGVDMCTTCEATTLTAEVSRRPKRTVIGQASLSAPARFHIPASLPLTQGCAWGRTAQLVWRTGTRVEGCIYGGWSAEAFSRPLCSRNLRAGDAIDADALWLRLGGAGLLCSKAVVELSLLPVACEAE